MKRTHIFFVRVDFEVVSDKRSDSKRRYGQEVYEVRVDANDL